MGHHSHEQRRHEHIARDRDAICIGQRFRTAKAKHQDQHSTGQQPADLREITAWLAITVAAVARATAG